MYDNYNYPAGSDTPDAPWNQSEPDDKDFLVDVEYVLQKKNVKVTTNDYKPEIVTKDEEIVEPLDTSDTDWELAYGENHYTIPELLDTMKGYLKQDLESATPRHNKHALKRMLEDCDGWELYDKSYCEAE